MAAKKRDRSARRARERRLDKLVKQRRKLAALEPGGSAARPLELSSASQVEPRAEAESCLRCEARVVVQAHRAETVSGQRLRIALTRCPKCGEERTHYFRLSGAQQLN